MQSLSLRKTSLEEVAAELRDTQTRLSDILPKLVGAREQMQNLTLRAPTSGQVVGLAVFTIGGVVSPGQTLMEIVPDTRNLVIQAQVNPGDADDVYQGQKATGGYSIELVEIRRDGTVLAVKVNERRPAFGDVTTQVITSPFVAVSIPRPPQGASVRLADEGKSEVEPETQQKRKIKASPQGRPAPRRRS